MYEASNYIYNLLNIKIEQLKEKGMLILPFPTGVGKTYNVIKYIKNNYKTKKIFFISNQLKLLPSLKKIIKDESPKIKEEISNAYLEIPSLMDGFRDYFKSNNIQDFYNEFEEIKEIYAVVKAYDNSKEEASKIFFYDKFHSLEREFRIKLKSKINDVSFSKKNKKQIEKLYPAALIYEKNIIMMTTKKFFLPLDTIFKSTIYLPEENFENTIVFIDEIDSTKGDLLDLISTTNQNIYNIDCIGLFRKIYESIIDINITGSLLFDNIEVDAEITDSYVNKGIIILNRLLKFKEKYFDLYYQVKNPFMRKIDTKESKTFIFKDKSSIVIQNELNTKQNELFIKPNEEKLTNFVIKEEHKDGDKQSHLKNIVDEVVYAIKGFMFEILRLARLYNEYHNKFGVVGQNFIQRTPLEKSLNSILDRLSLGEENRVFLLRSIFNITKTVEVDSKAYEIDGKRDRRRRKYDFYYDGFSFIQLLDFEDRDLQTKIFFNMYNVTPEGMLLKLATNYPVVGMSATANFDTCLKNYDLHFLKYKLEEKYLELSEKEIEEFNAINLKEKRNYEIEINEIPGESTIQTRVINYFDDSKIFEDELNLNVPLAKRKDIFNIIYEFKKFVEREAHSFIFFLNYNLNVYEKIIDFLNKWIKFIDSKCGFIVLDKSHFTKDGMNLKDKIFQKEKVFLISCYQTIGVGINLQYKLPKENIYSRKNLIYLDRKGKEKDIDGCFLSMPTNILPFYEERKAIPQETLLKLLYCMEYLKANDQIDSSVFIKAVGNIFYAKKITAAIGKYNRYKDINVGIMVVLVQAIGRICRTGVKNKVVYIEYEPAIAESIRKVKYLQNKYLLNYECQQFINSIKEPENDLQNLKKRLTIANIKTFKNIKDSLKWPWDHDKMIFWKKLREFVLRHPTASEKDFAGNREFQAFYLMFSKSISGYSVDKYNFTSKIDLLTSEYSNGLLEKRYYISDRDCDLIAIMKNEYFKDYFQRNAYATCFQENEYIMSPYLYHSIYKGALGEAVGKAIFSKYGLELKEITDVNTFELFDYKASNKYLDFKKWYSYFEIDEDEQLKKIDKKMQTCKTEEAFIINVIKDYYEDLTDEGTSYFATQKNVVTISWLYDIKEKKFNEIAINSIIGKVKANERITNK